MKYKSIFLLTASSAITFYAAGSTLPPTLSGTYTSGCEWSGTTFDPAMYGLATNTTLTFSENTLTIHNRYYQDSLCLKEVTNPAFFDDVTILTYTIGDATGLFYGAGVPVYQLKLATEDKEIVGFSCFLLDPKGFSDKEAFYLGNFSTDSNYPCELDTDHIFVK